MLQWAREAIVWALLLALVGRHGTVEAEATTECSEQFQTRESLFADLRSWHRFEAGALTEDSSGNGHTLTQYGTVVETADCVGGGGCASFGGSSYFEDDDSGFNGLDGTGITFSFWYYMTQSQGSYATILDYDLMYFIGNNNCGQNLEPVSYGDIGHARLCGSSDTKTQGTWHHFVTTVEPDGTWTNYLAGVQDDQGAKKSPPSTWTPGDTSNSRGPRIGWSSWHTHHAKYRGLFDELQIFTRALSAEEVARLYAQNADLRCVLECQTGHYLQNQTSGANQNYTCVACTTPAHCNGTVTCTGPGDSQCSSCNQGYVLSSAGLCVCQPGYSFNSGGVCVACNNAPALAQYTEECKWECVPGTKEFKVAGEVLCTWGVMSVEAIFDGNQGQMRAGALMLANFVSQLTGKAKNAVEALLVEENVLIRGHQETEVRCFNASDATGKELCFNFTSSDDQCPILQ